MINQVNENEQKRVLTAFRFNIPASEDRELYVTDKPVVIESFEWGHTDDDTIAPLLYNFNDDMSSNYNGNVFVSNRATARGFLRPRNIINDGSSYFEPKIYDEVADVYSFKLSQPIYMPNGARLLYRNFSDSSTVSTWHLVVRELT
ncbi:hypothetical protein HXA31_12700 [Salipaludibacillus agaradhaerens]|jgi:hypothetical protein|uniref:Uncharacterized protein n=1 Tax=Salipaludibacillus agaradhaerens TaxID=76935 RepID=A0A9Q4FXK3_SALAG|nr:hypothetical protein [Salipaludibacillus agaradhaerens]MCR6095222.1 hypothetical protein [Salipaludibacillus agaradhaerens]MCR6115220.1 hypothetical protein [Salipaludibacillus agaradhaerens]